MLFIIIINILWNKARYNLMQHCHTNDLMCKEYISNHWSSWWNGVCCLYPFIVPPQILEVFTSVVILILCIVSGSDQVFVSRGSNIKVVYLRPSVFWSTWPYITRTGTRATFLTRIQTTFRINRRSMCKHSLLYMLG